MSNQFSRTGIVLGGQAMERLSEVRVAVFGLGGVGGHAAEALIRSGIGILDIFDSDRVCLSNLNRQIIATHSTIGEYKVDAAKKRLLDINPSAVINTSRVFYLPSNADEFDLSVYSYVVDAIDTVTAKIELVLRSQAAGVPIISCMGTGNKLRPELLEIADIYSTTVCPLARVMRNELKKRGVRSLKVVYSKEPPVRRQDITEQEDKVHPARRQIPGSTAFIPATAGLIIAGEVVRHIAGVN